MKKKLYALLLTALVVAFSVAPCFALNSNGMPDWYPEDVSSFKDFHDPDAPRVVDNADIFSDAEEATMAEYIQYIQDDFGIDLVVFTDNSSYGLEHDKYAMDFYDFNGYGLGDDFNGTCLFICMEPGNRDWWTVWTGACKEFYTEANINYLDDDLEPFMHSGDYGEGVINYIIDVYYLYRAPDWYYDNSMISGAVSQSSRVFDGADILTSGEEQQLQAQIDSLRSAYPNNDFVILTDPYKTKNSTYETLSQFAKISGFDKKETFVFCIVKGPLGLSWNVELFGQYYNDEESRQQFLDRVRSSMNADNYYQASADFLNASDRFLSKGGKFPKEINFGGAGIGGVIAGVLAGAVRTGSMKSKMKSIHRATTANDAIVPGTFKLRRQNDVYINTTVTRVKRESSSSSSGGRSTYHSSSSGSSGRSHGSGGGRKF